MRHWPRSIRAVIAAVAAAALATLLSVGNCRAGAGSDGSSLTVSTGSVPPGPPGASATAVACRILWYTYAVFGVPGDVERLRTLGLDITVTAAASDISPANLATYDVLVIAYTPSGYIGAKRSVIASLVEQGLGLLIHQPNNPGAVDYAPHGFDVFIENAQWCDFPNAFPLVLVDGTHPVTQSLAVADLASNGDLVRSIGSRYTLLAASALCGDPALAAGTLAAGHVVFETGNASFNSVDSGSDRYWLQLFGWLCDNRAPTPARGATWGGLKVRYR